MQSASDVASATWSLNVSLLSITTPRSLSASLTLAGPNGLHQCRFSCTASYLGKSLMSRTNIIGPTMDPFRHRYSYAPCVIGCHWWRRSVVWLWRNFSVTWGLPLILKACIFARRRRSLWDRVERHFYRPCIRSPHSSHHSGYLSSFPWPQAVMWYTTMPGKNPCCPFWSKLICCCFAGVSSSDLTPTSPWLYIGCMSDSLAYSFSLSFYCPSSHSAGSCPVSRESWSRSGGWRVP